MRIAHTESSINMGGQELRILDQIRWLLDHGHAAWLLAREDSAIYRESAGRGLPRYAVPFRGSVNPGAVFKLLNFVRREKVDLIDCHSSRDASAAMIAHWLGVPVIRTHHICNVLKDDFFHRFIWARGSDRIITNSFSIAHRIVNQGLGVRDGIDAIGTGIHLHRFRPDIDGTPVRRAFGIPLEAKVITTVGMIRPDKAQRYLVRAVDRIVESIPDAYFMIVGSATKPKFQGRLEDEIDQIRNKDRVILTGFQHAVENFIAAGDVIVLTSMIDARTQVIPQAFAMKKIVVSSNVGGIPEVLTDGETGFLYPAGDVEELARLVVEALSRDVSPMIEKAYAKAQADLGFETMMDATLKSYRKVLDA